MTLPRHTNFRPLPLVAAGIAAGIVTAWFLPAAAYICAAVFCIFAAAIFLLPSVRKFTPALLALGVLTGIISGAIYLAADSARDIYAENARISGKITDSSLCSPDGDLTADGTYRIYLRDVSVNGESVRGKLYMTLPAWARNDLSVGDIITFTGTVYDYDTDPSNSASVSRQSDGIYYGATADNPALLTKREGKPLVTEKIRLRVKRVLFDRCGYDEASFLYAMIFGDSSYLDAEIASPFRETGTAHLFAVSGLHVGLLFYAFSRLVHRIRMPGTVKAVVTVGIMTAYCALCSFSPSVLRAAIMVSLVPFSYAAGRQYDALSSLSLAACLILAVKPLFLFDAGFLMSFFAVLGILCVSPALKRTFSHILPPSVSSVIAVSLAANAGIFPITMYCFGKLSLMFLPVNALVVPFISLLYPFMLAAVTVSSIIPAAGMLVTFAALPVKAVIVFVTAAAGIAVPAVQAVFPLVLMPVYYPLMYCASDYLYAGKAVRRCCAAACALCAAAAVILYYV